MPDLDPRTATRYALLTAVANVLCLVIAEAVGLANSNLAVWTTFMVMAQFTFTRFQKGVERVVGRGLGILEGLVLVTWFNSTALLALALIAVSLVVVFYLYFADRLAYTFLNAGLYLVVVFQIGHSNPADVVPTATDMFLAIVLGVVVADAVAWVAGAEHDLGIQLGQKPLWPVNRDWLSQSVMLTVTTLLTVFGAHLLGLPAGKSAISVMFLMVAPHVQAMIQKGELRIAGALMATGFSVVIFLLVGALPYFFLLAALLFFGQFLAAYLAQRGGTFAYAGLQMGLVLPMIVVAPRSEFGSIDSATARIEGILLGLGMSILVAGVWPRFPLTTTPAPAPPPAPAMPGEMDV